MNNITLTYIIAGTAGVAVLGLFVGFVLVPTLSAYGRIWERVVASVLSLYVVVVAVAIGVTTGGLVIWFWDTL